ncbi:MAG: SDR family oxidoreductase [Candidatus Latescibacterota bacterium]
MTAPQDGRRGSLELAGRTVIVTGASSGLGAALALELAAQGSDVVLFSPEEEKLQAVAARCGERGAGALAVVGDVTRPEDCSLLVERTVGRFGRLDCLVANAGISMWSRFDQVQDLGVFRRLMEVNYLGAVHCVHYALPHVKANRGLIVAITSIQARISVPLHSGYVASKHALQGFCETLRMELAGSGVGVLTVMPHWLRGTDLRRNALAADGGVVGSASRRHSRESVGVEEACQAILRAMRQRRRNLVIPWKLQALLVLGALHPGLADRIVMRAVRQQEE